MIKAIIEFLFGYSEPVKRAKPLKKLEEYRCDTRGCGHQIKEHKPPQIWSNAPCTVKGCECKEAKIYLGG